MHTTVVLQISSSAIQWATLTFDLAFR